MWTGSEVINVVSFTYGTVSLDLYLVAASPQGKVYPPRLHNHRAVDYSKICKSSIRLDSQPTARSFSRAGPGRMIRTG